MPWILIRGVLTSSISHENALAYHLETARVTSNNSTWALSLFRITFIKDPLWHSSYCQFVALPSDSTIGIAHIDSSALQKLDPQGNTHNICIDRPHTHRTYSLCHVVCMFGDRCSHFMNMYTYRAATVAWICIRAQILCTRTCARPELHWAAVHCAAVHSVSPLSTAGWLRWLCKQTALMHSPICLCLCHRSVRRPTI